MRTKNVSDIVPSIILSVVGVVITGFIIIYIVNSMNSSKALADEVIQQTEEISSEIADYKIKMYEGEEVRGSEVINFIKYHLGDYDETQTAPIFVEVVTQYSGTSYRNIYENNKYLKEIKNFSDNIHYIKPTAVFKGEVQYSDNRVILGITFTQE